MPDPMRVGLPMGVRREPVALQTVDDLSSPDLLVRARAQEELAALSLPGLGGPLASGGMPAGVSGLTPARIAVLATGLAAAALPVLVLLSMVLPPGIGGSLLGLAVFAAVVGAVVLMAIAGGRRAIASPGDPAQCAALQAWLAQHAFVHRAGPALVCNVEAPRRTLERAADRLRGGLSSLDAVADDVEAGLALADEARDLPVHVPEDTLRAVEGRVALLRDQQAALSDEVDALAALLDPAAAAGAFQEDLGPLLDRVSTWEAGVGACMRALTGTR